MFTRPIAVIIFYLMPIMLAASSPSEWDKLFVLAQQHCIRASQLERTTILGQPLNFEDKVLVVVKEQWPQSHMKNQPGTLICLYDKRSGDTEIQEAVSGMDQQTQ